MNCTVPRMLIVFLFASTVLSSHECIESFEVPFYPPLAIQARISGDVRLTFEIDEEGRAKNVKAKGHQLFTPTAIASIVNTKFDAGCRGPFDLTYLYEFEEELDVIVQQPVVFQSPNQFIISAPIPSTVTISCSRRVKQASISHGFWLKRVVSKLAKTKQRNHATL